MIFSLGKMIKENKLIDELKKLAISILSSTGFLKVVGEQIEKKYLSSVPSKDKVSIDFVIQVETKEKKIYWLLFEVKSLGQPRFARMAVERLRDYQSYGKNMYCVFGAPSIFKESQEICQKNGIGFIDLAGNCFFNFDNVYISIQGRPSLYRTTRPLKSLFTPAASRALRLLLLNPKKEWLVSELAKKAGISLGQASNLKRRLLDFEFIQETGVAVKKGKKFKLLNPELLLNKWAENYTYLKNTIRNFYSFDDIATIENKLANYLTKNGITYAFTLTSGASFVAPFLRYNRVFVYIKDKIEEIANALNLKEVSSGANVSLMEPYDNGVFFEIQDFWREDQGQVFKVVSDIQLYLDLKSYKERGEEAAEFILNQRLKKEWS